jgi:hypothetical protein
MVDHFPVGVYSISLGKWDFGKPFCRGLPILYFRDAVVRALSQTIFVGMKIPTLPSVLCSHPRRIFNPKSWVKGIVV